MSKLGSMAVVSERAMFAENSRKAAQSVAFIALQF
jgi:hypothetical protein